MLSATKESRTASCDDDDDDDDYDDGGSALFNRAQGSNLFQPFITTLY